MFKKIFITLLVLGLVFSLEGKILPVQAAPEWSYQYISQSSYPTLAPGEKISLELVIKNTGWRYWYNAGTRPTHLGTDHNRDRVSVFFTSGSWLSENRINMIEKRVLPGELAHFSFTITAPTKAGVYKEYFTPVIENVTWMADIGIYWEITVSEGGEQWGGGEGITSSNPADYSFEYVSQSAYPTLAPNGTTSLSLTIKNNGRAVWHQDGSNPPLRLGTSHPNDRPSSFFDSSSWLSANRIKADQHQVGVGENATFTFVVKAPSKAGVYKEYFTPVIDGVTWMKDIGIFWQITVSEIAPAQILNSLVISPASKTLEAGASQQFIATAYDINGNVISGVSVSWSVVAGGGTITSNGLFTAGSATGTFPNTIKAEINYGGISKTANATITVLSPQQSGGGGGGGAIPTAFSLGTLSSSTHPVSGNWYNKNIPIMSWTAATASNGLHATTPYYYLLDGNATVSASTVHTSGSPVAGLNVTLPAQADGTYYFHLIAKDTAGNISSSVGNWTIKIDTANPTDPANLTSALSAPSGSTITSGNYYNYPGPYFSWSAGTDALSGVAGYWVYFGVNAVANPENDGVFQTSASYTASSLTTNSTYYLKVKIQDNAGNLGTTKDFFTYKYDATNPVISNISPGANTTTASAEVSYTLSEAVNSGTITFTRTGGSPDPASPHTYNFTAGDKTIGAHTNVATGFNLVEDAIYTVVITAVDAAGNSGSTSVTNVTYSTNVVTINRAVIVNKIISDAGIDSSGYLKENGEYYLYANITASAGHSVTSAIADLSNFTAAAGAEVLTAGGPWTIEGSTYNYRSNLLTEDKGSGEGARSFDVSAFDDKPSSNSFSGSAMIDNTAPAAVVSPNHISASAATQKITLTFTEPLAASGSGDSGKGANDRAKYKFWLNQYDEEEGYGGFIGFALASPANASASGVNVELNLTGWTHPFASRDRIRVEFIGTIYDRAGNALTITKIPLPTDSPDYYQVP